MSARLTGTIRVAVLGSGGREHALASKIQSSPFCEAVAVLPGNAGMCLQAFRSKIQCLTSQDPSVAATSAVVGTTDVGSVAPVPGMAGGAVATDIDPGASIAGVQRILPLLKEFGAQLVVIGPDDLLFQGYADHLEKAGYAVFGPSRQASKVEWSKAFAKKILDQAGVPTARYVTWASGVDARAGLGMAALEFGGYPLVLKYDGLALGKGVKIAADENEALEFIKAVFDDRAFTQEKTSPATLICEEFTVGHEVSVFALCDGKEAVLLEPACDHKRLLDGNQGPNTGGMGAYSPVPWLSLSLWGRLKQELFMPVLKVLRESNVPFKGLLYAGLMVRGESYSVLEFNARFGDPETQALMPRLDSDLLPLLWGCAKGDLAMGLDLAPLRWSSHACVNVVAASSGYPEKPRTGVPIQGIDAFASNFRDVGAAAGHTPDGDVRVYFAGVKAPSGPGSAPLVTAGGRVFSVSATAPSLRHAHERAYDAIQQLQFDGIQYRRDVGLIYE